MSEIPSDRREPRFRTRTRVRLHIFDATSGDLLLGQLLETETRDFGPRGLFLAGVALPRDTRVHLYLDLPEGCIEAFGVVVHDRPQGDITGMKRAGVGVRFTHLSDADQARMQRHVASCELADRAAMQGALARLRAQQMTRRFGTAA